MDINTIIPITNSEDNINSFIAILISLYSNYTKDIILKKKSLKEGDLIYIIQNLLKTFYLNEKLNNLFNNGFSNILLLKFLNLTNNNYLREYVLNTKNFNLKYYLLCDLHNYLNINCLKFFTTTKNNNFYCDINNYYYLSHNNFELNFIEKDIPEYNQIYSKIINKIKKNPEILIIQKDDDKTIETNIVSKIISKDINIEKVFNMNTYIKSTDIITPFNDIIIFNNIKYKLDCCIINYDNNDYLLLHIDNKKYIYDISNEYIAEYNWNINDYRFITINNKNDINKKNIYDITKQKIVEYKFIRSNNINKNINYANSKNIIAIYTIIDLPLSNSRLIEN